MRYFVLVGNQFSAYPRVPKTLPEGAIVLRGIKDLDSRRFPTSRMVDLFKAFPNVGPRRLPNRKVAVELLWQALQDLPLGMKGRDSKQMRVVELMKHPSGASMQDLKAVTGWQAHSIRGFISATVRKKMKLKVVHEMLGDTRMYRIAR